MEGSICKHLWISLLSFSLVRMICFDVLFICLSYSFFVSSGEDVFLSSWRGIPSTSTPSTQQSSYLRIEKDSNPINKKTVSIAPTFYTIISKEAVSDDKKGEGGCSVDDCTVSVLVVANEPRTSPI